MTWNGKIGNDLVAEGRAKPKPPRAYKIVGQSPPRFDVPAKVFGKLDYVTDIKVPGMLHGRMIRPPVAGASPVAIDEGSVHDLPGIRVIRDKGLHRHRRRARMGRRAGSRAAARHLVRGGAALPQNGGTLRPHPPGAGGQTRGAGRDGRDRPHFCHCSAYRRSGVRMAVPVARQHGAGLRRRRCAARRGNLADRLAEAALRARRCGPRAGPAAGQGARDLGPGPGLLWAQRRRRCRDRCGAAVEGGGPAGPRPGHATKGVAGIPKGRPLSIVPAPRSTRMAR